jgi:hypothetical protein
MAGLAGGIWWFRRGKGTPPTDEDLSLQQLVERNRNVLNRQAQALLTRPPPCDAHQAESELDECTQLCRQIYALQQDIQRLIREGGPSDGRYRAAAVAALAEATLGLREALTRLHLHWFQLETDPQALFVAMHDKESENAIIHARKAVGVARGFVANISSTSHRFARACRSVLVVLGLRSRLVDDIGANDLVANCDQVDQTLEALQNSVAETINQKLTDQLELLSSDEISDEKIVEHLRQIVQECVHNRRSPQDVRHPILRLRLLEMVTSLATLPADWLNLRWKSLLSGYIGWMELFAAHAKNAEGNMQAVADHIQAARNGYFEGQRWAAEASLHRRYRIRFQKVLSSVGFDRKHPSWGPAPSKSEVEASLRCLITAISALSDGI